ncbi:hypothetical protein Ciccas_009648 [Cichlidogyrus casuarinus]|uniref:Amino acid transporter transmembrane domain-containing protein n=1 Tax=Cichlidogyrus casuarinus TaxID=1844966 RepID=A0ABD2PX42_9PLAT
MSASRMKLRFVGALSPVKHSAMNRKIESPWGMAQPELVPLIDLPLAKTRLATSPPIPILTHLIRPDQLVPNPFVNLSAISDGSVLHIRDTSERDNTYTVNMSASRGHTTMNVSQQPTRRQSTLIIPVQASHEEDTYVTETMDQEFSSAEAETAEKSKQSSIVTIFALWNTMMGTSLLTMPWGFYKAGFFTGIGCIILVGLVMAYSANRVLKVTEQYSRRFYI